MLLEWDMLFYPVHGKTLCFVVVYSLDLLLPTLVVWGQVTENAVDIDMQLNIKILLSGAAVQYRQHNCITIITSVLGDGGGEADNRNHDDVS